MNDENKRNAGTIHETATEFYPLLCDCEQCPTHMNEPYFLTSSTYVLELILSRPIFIAAQRRGNVFE
jgi:hypothetical protein